MNLKRLFTYALLSLAITPSSNAQTIGGGEVYYEQIGHKSYLVTAHVYRQCKDAPLNYLNGFVIVDTFKMPMNFKRIAIQKINDTCGNPCNSENTFSNKGFEKHSYQDTVNFNTSPYDVIKNQNICEVYFAIHQKLRESVTTMDIGNRMFYLEAMVNICFPTTSNHSPRFTFDPKLIANCNQPITYSPGPIDSFDFDSLSFELTTPMLSKDSMATYNGAFTKDIPMTPYCPPNPGTIGCRALPNAKPPRGFYFNKELCYFAFTPTKCDESGIIKFKMSEWRRDSTNTLRLIGSVEREIKISTQINSSNNAPYLWGNNQFSVCSGNKICFYTEANDDPFMPYQTIPDTVTMFSNNGIPMASFQLNDSGAREKESQFCWSTKPQKQSQRYIFGIAAYDQKCNISLSSMSYLINIKPFPVYKKSFSINNCNQVQYQVKIEDSSKSLMGLVQILNTQNKVLMASTLINDSFTINQNGIFYIRYSFAFKGPENCYVTQWDTIQVSNALIKGFEYAYKDTTVCKTFPATLAFHPTKINGISSWEWTLNDSFINSNDSVFNRLIFEKTTIKLRITDSRNCQSLSERTFNPIVKNINLFLKDSVKICPSLPIIITPNTNTLKSPLNFKWAGAVKNYNRLDTISYVPQSGDSIKLYIKDDNHCEVSDSFRVLLFPELNIKLKSQQQKVCKDSLLLITIETKNNIINAITKWKINGKDSVLPGSTLALLHRIKVNTQIRLELSDVNNCFATDSIEIYPLKNPQISIDSIYKGCAGDSISLEVFLQNNSDSVELEWSINGNLNSENTRVLKYLPTNNDKVSIRVSYQGICFAEDSSHLNIHPLPDFTILNDTDFNYLSHIHCSTSKPYQSYLWFNNQTTRDNSFWASELGPAGVYTIWCEVSDSNSCRNRESLRIYTDRFTPIVLPELFGNKLYPNPSIGLLYVEVNEGSVILIHSLDGKLVLEKKLSAGKSELNLTQFEKGIYLVKIGTQNYQLILE